MHFFRLKGEQTKKNGWKERTERIEEKEYGRKEMDGKKGGQQQKS
jgi:hypothetical protein